MDVSLQDISIEAKSSGIKSPESKMVDSMPTGWTNERHSQYLNSIEASFVNNLKNNEHLSKNFIGWLSSIRKQKHNAKNVLYGQIKVQRRGCWETINFERQVESKSQSRLLSANRWIQHFNPPSGGQDQHSSNSEKARDLDTTSSNQVDENALVIQSSHVSNERHGKEATSSKQLPTCSHLYCQDCVGINAEVSDQNFVDEEFERVDQSSKP